MNTLAHLTLLFAAAILCACIVLLPGCSKNDSGPVEPGPVIVPEYINTPYGIFPTGKTESVGGFLAAINERIGTINNVRVIGLFFGASSQQYIYAGTMLVNNNPVDTFTSFGSVVYSRPNSHISAPLDNVLFDGSYHHWRIGGSDSVAAFTDSVVSPDGSVIITAPAEDDGVRKDTEFTVQWTPTTTDSVLVTITDPNGKIAYAITTGDQVTFPKATLGTLASGASRVDVIRYKYHIAPAGTRNVLLLALSTDQRDITLYIPE